MTAVSTRAVAVVALLLAVAVSACGSSQPSSAVADDTSQPGASNAAASLEPSASAAAASQAPSEPAATPVAVKGPPPKPGKPTFKRVSSKPGPKKHTFTDTYRITWTEPDGAAEAFLIYGMPDCARESRKYQGKPCIVPGTPVDVDTMTLLATVPGDQRSTTISWDVGEVDIPPYAAVLMRATNANRNSIFTIVHSDDVCFGCTY